MFSAIRRRLHFSPATVIAGLALVFAMTGGAYAAKKYLITSTKQISPSVLKALQGKAGAAGAPGAAGAQGPAGPAGPQGSAGAAGVKGETGPAGAKGEKGATGAAGVPGVKGAAGATGATGASGATGFTETLPSGKTEMGNWVASATLPPGELGYVAAEISFPIPLAVPSAHVVSLNQIETEESVNTPVEGCELEVENASARPIAPPGTLCVFTRVKESGAVERITSFGSNESGDSPAGAFIVTKSAPAGALHLSGTWAVTAP